MSFHPTKIHCINFCISASYSLAIAIFMFNSLLIEPEFINWIKIIGGTLAYEQKKEKINQMNQFRKTAKNST